MDVTATVWTLLPPIIAIALALITKEVYSSLMIGILSGALLYTGFHPLKAVETTFTIMGSKLGDNINICIFLVLLGILVSLITKSGASRAYGEWAVKNHPQPARRVVCDLVPRNVHFRGRLLQLPHRRHGHAPGDGQVQHFPGKAGVHHRCNGGSGLHHRADLLVGGGGRLVSAGIEHAGRLLAVPQDHPVEPVRAAHAGVPHLADGC